MQIQQTMWLDQRQFFRCNRTVIVVALLIASLTPRLAAAQVPAFPRQPSDPADEDPDRRQALKFIYETEAAIAERQWLAAAETFDAAWELSVKREDPLLTLNSDTEERLQPSEHRIQAGARSRLENIFRNAPSAFRRAYQDHVQAPSLATERVANSTGRTRDIVNFILRYQFTKQAQSALQKLVYLHLSRGESLQAALQFGRLLRLQGDNSPSSRVQLAVLWSRAGLHEEAVDYLAEVARTDPGTEVVFDGQTHSVPSSEDDLRAWLDAVQGQNFAAKLTNEWLQPGGSYRRTLPQGSGPSLLKQQWELSTFDSLQFPELAEVLTPVAERLAVSTASRVAQGQTIVPAASPLLVQGLLIYRCVGHLQAVDAATGEIRWETLPLDRQMERLLEFLKNDENDAMSRLNVARNVLSNQLLSHLVRCNVNGQLTSDGEYLFSVEDSSAETMGFELGERNPEYTVPVNYLRAYDVQSGSFRGQAGGSSGKGGSVNPMAGMYFLGAPLVMGDRVYVMAENDQGIFLFQLRVNHPWGRVVNSEIDLRPVRSQLLSVPRHPLRVHPVRKYAGLIPSYSQGLLICNTCDEQVLAVSAEDHSVRWIYRYPSNVTSPELSRDIAVVANAFSMMNSNEADLEARWVDSLPQISAGRIFLTPRDSDRLICLDLHTGQQQWTHPRGQLRRIVFVDPSQIVLTGTESIESFDAATGKRNWTTRLRNEFISGAAVSDGRLLQVPTNGPAIVTLDLKTGRKVLQRSLNHDSPPAGNLLNLGDRMYSQSLTSISCLHTSPAASRSQLVQAIQLLLEGQLTEAEASLQTALNDQTLEDEDRQTARELLVRSMIESLRSGGDLRSDRIDQLQALIDQETGTDLQLATLIARMTGMSPGDIAQVPAEWRQVHRMDAYRSEVRQLVVQRRLNNPDEAADIVAQTIVGMLQDAANGSDRIVKTAAMSVREMRSMTAAIHAARQLRSSEERQQLDNLVDKKLQPLIQSADSVEQASWWLDVCLQCGFVQAALQAVTVESNAAIHAIPAARREWVLLAGMELPNADLRAQAWEHLKLHWVQTGRTELVTTLADRSLRITNGESVGQANPALTVARGFVVTSSDPAEQQTLQDDFKSLAAERLPQPWRGTPQVTPSPAHSAQQSSPMLVMSAAPQTLIPVYGAPGAYANWQFMQRIGSRLIFAYDGDGNHRWSFDPGDLGNSFGLMDQQRPVQAQYIVGYGNLLTVKMYHRLYVLDGLSAGKAESPKLLWSMNLSQALEFGPRRYQSTPAWQRVTQYCREPSGLDPVGPMTRHGIPIYAQRQLSMRNLLTGRLEWRIDGLPPDCSITATDKELVLISPASGELQVRSPLDGRLLRNFPLPEWWVEATENSSASIRDIEVEPDDEHRWRIAVQQNHCFLLRRAFEESTIEAFDLSRGKLAWSIVLPQDSVVSNIVDGHVAVLSDGERLQLFDLVSGQRRLDSVVASALDSRELHLRLTGQHWLVLTNVSDPKWDLNPISNSVQVNGYVYAFRQSDYGVAWSQQVDRELLRVRYTNGTPPLPIPSVAPVLVLMKRPATTAAGGLRQTPYQVKMIDVRSGDLLYEEADVGKNLSYHAVRLNNAKNNIEFSFNKRNVQLQYDLPVDHP